MPKINILNLLPGDSQSGIIDKINYNFDQILSSGGGPQGQQGPIGPTGPIGPQGPQGVQGLQGPSGTKWFVQGTTAPASGSIYGNNSFLYPTLGDYWLDIASSDQEIYFYNNGWVDTGFGLAQGSIFQNLPGVKTSSLTEDFAGILIAGIGGETSRKSLILSDKVISDYQQGGVVIENTNFENAKLKIATNSSRNKLISFSRSDFDTAGFTGATGAFNNPSIEWDSFTYGTGPEYYNITFKNPTGSISIRSENSSTGGINIHAGYKITAQSQNENIIFLTSSAERGIYANVSPTQGFFEVSSAGSPGMNSPNAWFYVNSTGAGIGVGTGSFKMTGLDSRRLAVKGNVSISNSATGHTNPIFYGVNPARPNYNKGSLYVQGHTLLGYPSPTGLPDIINATGISEALGFYPQLLVTSPTIGPVIEAKSSLGASGPSGYTSRTVIGDGLLDAMFGENVVSGINSTITQEIHLNGLPLSPNSLDTSTLNGLPLSTNSLDTQTTQKANLNGLSLSTNSLDSSTLNGLPWEANSLDTPSLAYQHKITTPSNITGGSPVFGITTFIKPNATILGDFPTKTVIQTKNDNNVLYIQANGLPNVNNKVYIGTSNSVQIALHGATGSIPDYATTTIGYKSSSYTGYGQEISSSIATFGDRFIPSDVYSIGTPSHALVVAGTQTIGTTDPISAFVRSSNQSECVSAVSMLKIHRNLGTELYSDDPSMPPVVTGYGTNNWPNGLEITSYKAPHQNRSSTGANESVAIAVGVIRKEGGTASKGFLVSDDGKNIAINRCINYSANLSIQTNIPHGGTAIQTNGNIYANEFHGKFIGSITSTNVVPIGGIIMWSGPATPWDSNGLGNGVLNGWALCNGNTHGSITTPDLRGRFIVGYGNSTGDNPVNPSIWDSNYGTLGQTGGLKNVKLTANESGLPTHTHANDINFTTSGNDGGHVHAVPASDDSTGTNKYLKPTFGNNIFSISTLASTGFQGNHSHNLTKRGSILPSMGVDARDPHENRPPYYVLAFIMRIS